MVARPVQAFRDFRVRPEVQALKLSHLCHDSLFIYRQSLSQAQFGEISPFTLEGLLNNLFSFYCKLDFFFFKICVMVHHIFSCVLYLRNICHGSDSVETAKKEISLWFKVEELVDWEPATHVWIYE